MDESVLRLALIPQCKILDDIILQCESLRDSDFHNGLKTVKADDQTLLVEALLHNLQVVLQAQKSDHVTKAKSAVNSQLNTFVAELYEVNCNAVEKIVQNHSKP